MTRDEAKKLLYVVANTYPNFKANDMKVTLDAWEFFLSDYDYNTIALALKAYVQSSGSGFPPSVSELIDMAHKPKELAELNDMEAWDLVYKAICNSAYNSQEEFDKLSPEIQRAVGSANQLHSWAMDDNFNASVIGSNFQRSYRTLIERKHKIARLPEPMQNQIGELRVQRLEAK